MSLKESGSALSCWFSGEFTPNTLGMSTAVFSSSALAIETAPTLQPARVNGTHGAGVVWSGGGAGVVVAGGVGEYTMDGFVSWPAVGDTAVSKNGSVQ